MSAKMGRPLKGEEPRTERIHIRVSKSEAEKISYCAENLNVPRVDAIMQGIDLLTNKIKKRR